MQVGTSISFFSLSTRPVRQPLDARFNAWSVSVYNFRRGKGQFLNV